MQFTQGLHRAVQIHPHATATICGNRRRTFLELRERVARLAAAFNALDIQAGDRVAMLSLNSDHYLEFYLAGAWAGVIVNPVNFRWSTAEIVYSLNDSQSVALIVDDTFLPQVDAVREQCPTVAHVIHAGDAATPALLDIERLIAEHAPIADREFGGDDLFGIFYTGGTTGFPKGVLLSHANLCTAALGLMADGAFPEGAIGLHAAPMFHLADMAQTTCLLLRGGCHVMLPTFRPDIALATVAEHRVSDLLLVPAMVQALVDYPGFDTYDTRSVQRLLYGGAPMAEAIVDRAQAALPQVRFTQVYGMTESSAIISVLPPSQHASAARASGRLRSAGRAALHLQLRIVDADDNELPGGAVGEIAFRSPGMMQGYLNQGEASTAALRNGWMHTGDAGYLDDEGYLYVVDRLKDMIISGGENIYCAEVENAVCKHPSVQTCAVIGIPDDEWGEAVHAVIVPKPDRTIELDDVRAHCRELIAGYKCPRSIEIRESLPMTGAGKIKKLELREAFWKERQRAVN